MSKLARALSVYGAVFLLLIFLTGLFYRACFFVLHPMHIGPDQSVYLAFAQIILKGAVPYRDIYDFNFPLIMYLSTLPVLIWQALPLPLPLPLVFDCFIYAIFALSVLLVVLVFSLPKQKKTPPFAMWAVLFAMLWLQQSQLQDLGQREHIFVLLYMPYFVLRYFAYASPLRKGPLQIALAIVCGVLACSMHLKPHLFLTVLAAELFLLVGSGGSFKNRLKGIFESIEIRTVLILTALYLVHFAFYPAGALHTFFEQAVPTYITGFGWFNTSLLSLFMADPSFCTTTVWLLVALLLAIPLAPRCLLLMPVLGFTLSSLVLYALFITAWTYRYLPVQAGVYLLVVLEFYTLVLMIWPKLPVLARLSAAIFVPPCALLFMGYYVKAEIASYYKDVAAVQMFDLREVGSCLTSPSLELSPIFYAIVKNTAAGDRVLFIGTGVAPGYPAILQAGRLPASRYLHGMHLPMLNLAVQEERGSKYSEWLAEAVSSYGKDIASNKPTLIFVQGGEISEILERYNFFDKYLGAYENLGPLGFDSLTVYKIKGEGQGELAQGTVLDIIQGRLTLEAAARSGHTTVAKVSEQVTRTRAAIQSSLSHAPGGGELSARAELLKLQEQLFEAQKKLINNSQKK